MKLKVISTIVGVLMVVSICATTQCYIDRTPIHSNQTNAAVENITETKEEPKQVLTIPYEATQTTITQSKQETTKKQTTANIITKQVTKTKEKSTTRIIEKAKRAKNLFDKSSAISLGKGRITVYIPDDEWGYTTSTGAKSTHLKTCAVDPNVIPYGSTVIVTNDNGQELRMKAVDCGGLIDGNDIDIFYDGNEKTAYNWYYDFFGEENMYYSVKYIPA